MARSRLCSRPACAAPAAVTLTFQYATRTLWLDDLAEAEPQTLDLCARHGDTLRPPRGWTGHDRRAASEGQIARAG